MRDKQARRDVSRVMRSQIQRGLVGILSIAIVALTISAANAQSGSASSSNAGGAVTIRVVANDALNNATPFFVALKLGYFKDAGLDVQYASMGGGAPAMAAALKSGQVDIALAGALQHMTQIAMGVISGKIIGEFLNGNNYQILATNGITDISQLKGKIFGVSSYNGGDQLWAQGVMSHYGIGNDDVTLLPVGVPAGRFAALSTGKVDATVIAQHQIVIPDKLKDKVRVIATEDDRVVPFIGGAVFARQDFIASNKPALRKFLAAIGKGADWTRAHPNDAMDPCLASGASVEQCKTGIEFGLADKDPYTWSSTTRVNAEGIKAMISIYAAAAPPMKTMTVDDFVDLSVVGDGTEK
jgi:NitT/TauT family transport system substrate-binding protein